MISNELIQQLFYYKFEKKIWKRRHISLGLQKFENTSWSKGLDTRQTFNSK